MLFTALLLFASVHFVILEEYVIPENIDIDEILANDRLLQNYVNCILEKGKKTCTPEGEKLKKAIPEALQNGCEKCNDKVKEQIKKVIRHLSENKKEIWKELVEKFDPKGEFQEKYKDMIAKENIKV